MTSRPTMLCVTHNRSAAPHAMSLQIGQQVHRPVLQRHRTPTPITRPILIPHRPNRHPPRCPQPTIRPTRAPQARDARPPGHRHPDRARTPHIKRRARTPAPEDLRHPSTSLPQRPLRHRHATCPGWLVRRRDHEPVSSQLRDQLIGGAAPLLRDRGRSARWRTGQPDLASAPADRGPPCRLYR